MKKHLYKILGISKLHYLNEITFQYNIWCEWLSCTHYVPMLDFQRNNGLYYWFIDKYQTRILETFCSENADFINAGVEAPETYRTLLRGIITRPECNMIGIYPKPLVEQIKNNHYKSLQKND